MGHEGRPQPFRDVCKIPVKGAGLASGLTVAGALAGPTHLAGGRGAGAVLAVAGQHVGRLVHQDVPDTLQGLAQYGPVRWGRHAG